MTQDSKIHYHSEDKSINSLIMPFPHVWKDKAYNNSATFTYSFAPSLNRVTDNEKVGVVNLLSCVLLNSKGYLHALDNRISPLVNLSEIEKIISTSCKTEFLEYEILGSLMRNKGEFKGFFENSTLFKTHDKGSEYYDFIDHLSSNIVYNFRDLSRSNGSNDKLLSKALTNIFEIYSSVANITFSLKNENADITIKLNPYSDIGVNGLGISQLAEQENSVEFANIVINAPSEEKFNLFCAILIHEFGHVLDLKHPHFEDSDIPYLPSEEDNTGTSIMSYKFLVMIGEQQILPMNSAIKYTKDIYPFDIYHAHPLNLGIYDIRALHYLYGKNIVFRKEDTVYKFCTDCTTSVNEDNDIVLINANMPQSFTIYDSGGVNTLDLRNENQTALINLSPFVNSAINNINIIGNSYFWFMASIAKVMTSSAPIFIEFARDIGHNFELSTEDGVLIIGAGQYGQNFYISANDTGKLCILGFQPNDKIYLSKELFNNKSDVFQSILFQEPSENAPLFLEKKIYYLDVLQSNIAEQLGHMEFSYYSCKTLQGHVTLCLDSNCNDQLNLFYHDDLASKSFTVDNIDLF